MIFDVTYQARDTLDAWFEQWLIESNALNSEKRISIYTRYDRICRKVSLIFHFISCKYSLMLIRHIYFILLFNVHGRRILRVIRKMLVPRKRIKTAFPFTSANSFTVFPHFLSKTWNFDESFYKLFDSNFLSL